MLGPGHLRGRKQISPVTAPPSASRPHPAIPSPPCHPARKRSVLLMVVISKHRTIQCVSQRESELSEWT